MEPGAPTAGAISQSGRYRTLLSVTPGLVELTDLVSFNSLLVGSSLATVAYRRLAFEAEMSAVFHGWLEWLALVEDKPANTVRAYSQGVRRIVSYAGLSPSDFSPHLLDQASLTDTVWVMCSSGEVSGATVRQSLAALRSFYDYCLAERLGETVPNVDWIRKIAKLNAPRGEPDSYRPAEVRALFEAAGRGHDEPGGKIRWAARDLVMCGFLAVMGLRASELVAADLNWVSRERLVDADDRATWMLRVVGKGRRIRRIPLTGELVEANDRWQVDRLDRFGPFRPDDPLFVTNDGARLNYGRLRHWLKTLNQAAGLRERPLNAFRTTLRNQLLEDGVSIEAVRSLLGMERPDHL